MQILQNEALRLVTGCFRTTPLNIIHHLAGVEILSVRREFLLSKYIGNAISITSNNPILKNLKTLQLRDKKIAKTKFSRLYKVWLDQGQDLKQVFSSNKILTFEIPYEGFYLDNCIDTISGRILIEYVQKVFDRFMTKYYPNSTIFYTDGSKILGKGCGASSISIMQPKYSSYFKINGNASIFTTETIAIEATLIIILHKNITNTVICTDSLSVLLTLQQTGLSHLKHPIIASIRSKLTEIFKRNWKCRLIWVTAQKGIKGNEIANKCAKKVIIQPLLSREVLVTSDWSALRLQQMKEHMYASLSNYGDENGLKGVNYISRYKKFSTKA